MVYFCYRDYILTIIYSLLLYSLYFETSDTNLIGIDIAIGIVYCHCNVPELLHVDWVVPTGQTYTTYDYA